MRDKILYKNKLIMLAEIAIKIPQQINNLHEVHTLNLT